ncbi:MAG: hypothetical protein GX181_05150 [Synergistaceae bacterium]|nr:hypothetical protein [Synergistaceae bacterium]
MSINKQIPEGNVAVLASPEKATLYIDNINIMGNDGAVIFDFMQFMPGIVKNEKGEKMRQAAIVSRTAITTQHFRRFVEACGKVLSDIDSSERKREE